MVIFYMKETGNISMIIGGDNQSIETTYGDDAPAIKLIMDTLVLTDDSNVLANPRMFKVNPTTKKIELSLDTTKYIG